jgi:hypothetical protein
VPVFPTNSDELIVTGDAPEHGRRNRTRERARGHLGAPKSPFYCGGFGLLRRAISSIWSDLSRGEKRGQREERGGFIGEALMAITVSNYRGNYSGRFQERERE